MKQILYKARKFNWSFFEKNNTIILFYLICVYFFFSPQKAFSNEEISAKNIARCNASASNIIPFMTTKTLSDGALKVSLLEMLKDFFHLDLFVESGTNLGNTSFIASQIFEEVHTVEIFPDFYLKACDRFKSTPNVFLYFGDSTEFFPQLLSTLNKRIIFYLDGHFDGGYSGKGIQNTPILKELEAISYANRSDFVILIDDICDFQESKFQHVIYDTCFEGYPTLKELIAELLHINSKYQFCFLGNALLAFPQSEEIAVSPVANACTIDRFSTITKIFSEDFLLIHEEIIASAKGNEKNELCTYFEAYAPFEWHYGWRSFSSLWYGLLLLKEGRKKEAKSIFSKTASNSLPHWRIDCYFP